MQALIQRVSRASVTVGQRQAAAIGHGLLVLLCAERGDTEAQAGRLLDRLLKLRVFADAAGKMNLDVGEVGGALLIVSQFTLAADTSRGRRPSFAAAAAPEDGRRLYEFFLARARALHPVVACGEFGADMQVALVNDGPVTMTLRVAPPPAAQAAAASALEAAVKPAAQPAEKPPAPPPATAA